MKFLFWFCLALTTYTYVGYFLWLWLQSSLCQQSVLTKSHTPTVSIVIAARNEETNLPLKLDNLFHLEYPRDRLQIVIVSDGSTDQTPSILRDNASRVKAVVLDKANGKAHALNEAVKHTTGQILVFLDVRQIVEAGAIAELVGCFEDTSVGAVSGDLILEDTSASTRSAGVGIYWKMEKSLRRMESATGSVVGVTGAIYAIRRELYTEIPHGTILDDVFIPMHIARCGKRVVFQSKAVAHDRIFEERHKEFSRKVRTLTGNYQLLRLEPWLLSLSNPLLFRFVSHKLLRLIVPLLLVFMLVSSAMLRVTLYQYVFWAQVLLYGLAFLGSLQPKTKRFKLVALANTFVMLNAAAAIAFYNFSVRREDIW